MTKFFPGAVIENVQTGIVYVRDSKGAWYGDNSPVIHSDELMNVYTKRDPEINVIRTVGYFPEVKETRNFGATVLMSDVAKAVFDGKRWIVRWPNGGSSKEEWEKVEQYGPLELVWEGIVE